MGLFDVHAHLTSPRLLPQVPALLERARAAGITTIVSNGLNPQDNRAVLELAEQDSLVKPAIGFYPVDTVLEDMRSAGVEYPREDEECSAEEGIAFVREHAHLAFAIGEIGLDGYWVPEAFWQKQEDVFRTLVRIAMDADKAIIIHTRKRERRAFEILLEMGAPRVDWHCFGGKVKLAREIAQHDGHYFSIPSNARRSESFTRMLQTLPRERVLLETDCPYLGAEPGVASEPAHVAGTAGYAGELWNESAEATAAQLSENFFRLFRVAA
jgi:TatD DNase family protein